MLGWSFLFLILSNSKSANSKKEKSEEGKWKKLKLRIEKVYTSRYYCFAENSIRKSIIFARKTYRMYILSLFIFQKNFKILKINTYYLLIIFIKRIRIKKMRITVWTNIYSTLYSSSKLPLFNFKIWFYLWACDLVRNRFIILHLCILFIGKINI